MKLVVERTGGFAGLKRRGERDAADLSPAQRAALDLLVKDSALGKAAADQQSSSTPAQDPGADRFTYRVEIQDENGTRSITLPESKMPTELKTIVIQ